MKSLTSMLTLLVLTAPLAAQDSPVKKIPWANKFFTGKPDNPPPVILQDFGALPKGTVKTYRFKMTNIYDVPMQVRQPQPNCGCVEVLEYTGTMPPLHTGYIDIKVDTSRVEGPKVVEMPVRFQGQDKAGQPFESTAKLEVRVVSRPDIGVNPGAFNFGQVPAGQKGAASVVITYAGAQPNWAITEIGLRKELFDHEVKAVNVRGARAAFQVTLTLKPDAPAGNLDERIELKTNEPGGQGVVSLAIRGQVQPPLGVIGGEHRKLDAVVVGQRGDHRVVIQADKPFRVTAVEGQGDGITVPLPAVPAAKAQIITVTFTPEKPGPVKKTLTVKTDTGKSISLTIEGIGKEPQ
jgi:hypothetical protein